jgi:hypothetical protein
MQFDGWASAVVVGQCKRHKSEVLVVHVINVCIDQLICKDNNYIEHTHREEG